MKQVKVKILETYTRNVKPKFIFRKGQTVEILLTEAEVKYVKQGDGELYKIVSIKSVKK